MRTSRQTWARISSPSARPRDCPRSILPYSSVFSRVLLDLIESGNSNLKLFHPREDRRPTWHAALELFGKEKAGPPEPRPKTWTHKLKIRGYAAGKTALELLRGQSLQFRLPPPRVPMDDVGLEVGLEGLEVRPSPCRGRVSSLIRPNKPFRARVVQAVALARTCSARCPPRGAFRSSSGAGTAAHVAAQYGPGAPRHLRQQHIEHLLLLREARRLGYRPCDDLAAGRSRRPARGTPCRRSI